MGGVMNPTELHALVSQAYLHITFEMGDLDLRRLPALKFRHQLHPPHQLWHQLTLVP